MESKYICIHRNKHLLNISAFQIIRLTKCIILWSTIDDLSQNCRYYSFKEHYWRILVEFYKKQIQIIANERISTRLKKSMVQVDAIQGRKRNTSHTPAQNRCWYQKVLQNSIKSAGYVGGRRKLPLQYTLILQMYLPKAERFTFFICLFDTTRDSKMAL